MTSLILRWTANKQRSQWKVTSLLQAKYCADIKSEKKVFSTYMFDFPFLVLDVVGELAGLSVPHILVLSDNSCQRPSYSARFRSIQKDLHMQEKVVWLEEYLNLLKLYHCRVINQKRVLP